MTYKRKKGRGRKRRKVSGHTRNGKRISPYYRRKRKDIRKKRTVKKRR